MNGKGTPFVTVADRDGRQWSYIADDWEVNDAGYLNVFEAGAKPGAPSIATFAPGWTGVHRDPNATARKLQIALSALREIVRTNVTDTNEDGTRHAGVAVLRELASQALEDAGAEDL